RKTWAQVVPIADAAAQLFYQRLFEIDPDAKSLFANTDMPAQNEKLVDTLSLVVEKADQLDSIVPVLQELGRKHLRYGVEDRHYDSVGSALLWTLGQGLGEGFTGQARAAWTVAYALVSGPMRQAAADSA
ncbi:MAG: globin family protein, partial [Pseudomonadota bacterium]